MPEFQLPLDDSMSAVADEVKVCTRCPLSLARTLAVAGEGPPDARVVVVGEGPGRNEDLQGRPFVGAAGRQLEVLLEKAGLDRGEVYITNVVKCRPPDNRRPTGAEVDSCSPFLERQLGLLRPSVVVLLGDTALKRFLPSETLSTAHGRLFGGRPRLFATYHPAAMIYNRSLEKVVEDDFVELGKVLAGLAAEG